MTTQAEESHVYDESNFLKELRLGAGSQVIVHEEDAYEKSHLDGRSFNDVKGYVSDLIRFTQCAKFHKDGVVKLLSSNPAILPKISANPLIVQHNHLKWMYLATLQLNEEGKCRLSINSVGPSLRGKEAKIIGAFKNNWPEGQTAPRVTEVTCAFLQAGHIYEVVAMQNEGDGFKSTETIPTELLTKLTEKTNIITLRIQMTIPTAYFQLNKILPKQIEEPVHSNSSKMIEIILEGKKPNGWDWIITVGESNDGQSKDYFVHGQLLAHGSWILDAVMRERKSSVQKQIEILVVSHENRIILPTVHANDMPCLLTYFYTRRFALPHFLSVFRLGKIFCALVGDQIERIFASWELEMIQEAELLDKKDYKKTLPRLAELLIGHYSAPYGAMPAAKRVLISTFSDVWSMAEGSGVDMEKFAEEEPAFKASVPLFERVTLSAVRFKSMAASVDKEYV